MGINNYIRMHCTSLGSLEFTKGTLDHAPPASRGPPPPRVVVGWGGAPTGSRCPVFSTAALQDLGLQLQRHPTPISYFLLAVLPSSLFSGRFCPGGRWRRFPMCACCSVFPMPRRATFQKIKIKQTNKTKYISLYILVRVTLG